MRNIGSMKTFISNRNAIKALGFKSKDVENAEDIANAEMIIFPGQGCFKQAVEVKNLIYINEFIQKVLEMFIYFTLELKSERMVQTAARLPSCKSTFLWNMFRNAIAL